MITNRSAADGYRVLYAAIHALHQSSAGPLMLIELLELLLIRYARF
ncbi:hypothetical protein PSPO01_03084 [Paraphaeosphaeria sporulosa]